MTIFIIGIVILLGIWLYWSIMGNSQQFKLRKPFNSNQLHGFDVTPEVSIDLDDDIQLPQNSIKLSGQDAANLRAYWFLEQEMLEKVAGELDLHVDQRDLVLRLYEAGELVHFHDISTKNMKGSCRLQLNPLNAYYLSLGIMDNNRFIPVLTSNTVIKHQ